MRTPKLSNYRGYDVELVTVIPPHTSEKNSKIWETHPRVTRSPEEAKSSLSSCFRMNEGLTTGLSLPEEPRRPSGTLSGRLLANSIPALPLFP